MSTFKPFVSFILLVLITGGALVHACSFRIFGFEVYESDTHSWSLTLGTISVGEPKTFTITVECKEPKGKFLVTYFLQITGPETLCNDYLRVQWQDTDGAEFAIGKEGDQQFLGEGMITWSSDRPVVFEAGHKNTVTLILTFLTTGAIGDYNAKFWVAFTERPEATVSITPRTLNVRSEGQWVQAQIRLPALTNVRDSNVDSVKLWFEDSYVEAEWVHITGNSLMAKFSRSEVTEMLATAQGKVDLAVTGSVKDVEFYGTDTITIIKK